MAILKFAYPRLSPLTLFRATVQLHESSGNTNQEVKAGLMKRRFQQLFPLCSAFRCDFPLCHKNLQVVLLFYITLGDLHNFRDRLDISRKKTSIQKKALYYGTFGHCSDAFGV